MEETIKPHRKAYDWLKPYQFQPGNNANPKGRPKGKTLKEFAREYLASLPDDRKVEYLASLPEDIVWKMAEGNPDNKSDFTSGGERLGVVPLAVLNRNDIPSNNSIREDNKPTETN